MAEAINICGLILRQKVGIPMVGTSAMNTLLKEFATLRSVDSKLKVVTLIILYGI
jgi:hypothetical protein